MSDDAERELQNIFGYLLLAGLVVFLAIAGYKSFPKGTEKKNISLVSERFEHSYGKKIMDSSIIDAKIDDCPESNRSISLCRLTGRINLDGVERQIKARVAMPISSSAAWDYLSIRDGELEIDRDEASYSTATYNDLERDYGLAALLADEAIREANNERGRALAWEAAHDNGKDGEKADISATQPTGE